MGKEQDLLQQYTLYYQNQLDNWVGSRALELDPLYRRLQAAAVKHLEDLY